MSAKAVAIDGLRAEYLVLYYHRRRPATTKVPHSLRNATCGKRSRIERGE